MKEFNPLSKRELEVSELLVFGATCQDAANSLFLSIDTIITHKKNIYRKLNIRKETELSKWYFCRRFNISINIKPIAQSIVALAMLFLLGGEAIANHQNDMLRTAKTRTSRVRTSRVRRTKEY